MLFTANELIARPFSCALLHRQCVERRLGAGTGRRLLRRVRPFRWDEAGSGLTQILEALGGNHVVPGAEALVELFDLLLPLFDLLLEFRLVVLVLFDVLLVLSQGLIVLGLRIALGGRRRFDHWT